MKKNGDSRVVNFDWKDSDNPKIKNPRQLKKSVDNLFKGQAIVTTRQYKKTAQIVLRGSNFYSPEEQIQKLFSDSLKNILIEPIKKIDAKDVILVEQTEIEFLRFRAKKYLRQYFTYNSFLMSIFSKSKKYPLSESQCIAVINTCKNFKSKNKEVSEGKLKEYEVVK